MKVLFVLDSFYPNIDGPVNVIANVAKILNAAHLADVELLVPNFYKKNVNLKQVKIHRSFSINGPEGYRVALPGFSNKVKNLIKNGGYDLIHVHSPFTLGKYAINMAKKYNIPVLTTVHTKYKSDFERKLKLKCLQNFMLNYIMKPINKSDYVLSVSNGAAETVKEYGYTGKEIFVIRNGTDLEPALPSIENVNMVVNKYNLHNNFVFLFVGRIVENKNIQFSLEVLKKIKESGINNFKFLIVGQGDYTDKLKALVKEFNLKENVVFTGRINNRETLSSIYAAADLFLFPSAFDTCGIVAIEAAANQLPSVMLKNTCASEVINSGVNGFAFEENTNTWAEEITKIMKDKNSLNSIKQNALETVYVSWEDISMQYFNFYKKVLNKEI